MLDYQTFCYLQNQKTGCTFVEEFLREFSNEPLKSYSKHATPEAREPGKFYFVNVRDPLDAYLSLFNFGSASSGAFRNRVAKAGAEHLYDPDRGADAFDIWLTSILNPQFVRTIYPELAPVLAQTGLVSTRFLRYATFGFTHPTPAVQRILRFETLREDLAETVECYLPHAVKDRSRAAEWIANAPPANASVRRERSTPMILRRGTIRDLLARERPLYGAAYADSKSTLERLANGERGSVLNLEVID